MDVDDVKGQNVDDHDNGVKGHDHDENDHNYERRHFRQSYMRIMMNFEFHSSLSLFNLKLYLGNFDTHRGIKGTKIAIFSQSYIS